MSGYVEGENSSY